MGADVVAEKTCVWAMVRRGDLPDWLRAILLSSSSLCGSVGSAWTVDDVGVWARDSYVADVRAVLSIADRGFSAGYMYAKRPDGR